MKIIGIILGAVSIILCGFSLREKLKKRVSLLEELIFETEILKKSVLVYKKPIDEILKELSLPPYNEISAENLNEEAFSVAKECVKAIKQCSADETAIISDTLTKIRDIKKDAEKELRDKGNMYIKLSVCLALLFVVIVI